MPTFDMHTGKGLRAAREIRGLSRKALANAAGIDPYTVRYWERKAFWKNQGWATERMLKALGMEMDNSRTVTHAHVTGFEEIDARIALMPIETPQPRRRQTRCGAKTRKGHPCLCKAIPGKLRCKFHGGMSTGPRTPEGRARIAEATRQRWAKWREDRAQA